MRHLTRDELLEALEARSDSNHGTRTVSLAWAAHIEECAVCASELRELSSLLEELSSITVPEPSPLFWDSLSQRVSRATEREDRSRRAGWRAWWPVHAWTGLGGWRWLVPAAAAVIVLLVVAGTWRAPEAPATRAAAPAASGAAREAAALGADVLVDAPPAGDDEPWLVLSALAAEADEADEQAAPLSVGAPGDADHVILHLSEDERAELGRLLEAEIGNRRDRVEG